MAYEIQEWCLCGGWTNTWSWEDDNGVSVPTTYETKQDAEDDLDDFFYQMRDDFKRGNIEDVPDREDFRIIEVKGQPVRLILTYIYDYVCFETLDNTDTLCVPQ